MVSSDNTRSSTDYGLALAAMLFAFTCIKSCTRCRPKSERALMYTWPQMVQLHSAEHEVIGIASTPAAIRPGPIFILERTFHQRLIRLVARAMRPSSSRLISMFTHSAGASTSVKLADTSSILTSCGRNWEMNETVCAIALTESKTKYWISRDMPNGAPNNHRMHHMR